MESLNPRLRQWTVLRRPVKRVVMRYRNRGSTPRNNLSHRPRNYALGTAVKTFPRTRLALAPIKMVNKLIAQCSYQDRVTTTLTWTKDLPRTVNIRCPTELAVTRIV